MSSAWVWRLPLLAYFVMVHYGIFVSGQLDEMKPTLSPAELPDGDNRDSPDRAGLDILPTDTIGEGSIYENPGYVRVDFPMKNYTKYLDESVRINCEITGDPLPRYKWYKDDISINENDRRFKIKRTNWGSRISINNLRPEDSGNYTCMGYNRGGQARSTGEVIVLNEPNPNEDKSLPIDPFPKGFPKDHFSRPDSDTDSNPGYQTEGFCQPYRGATCSKFVGKRSIFVTSRTMQNSHEERFIAAFTIMASLSELSRTCHEYAIPSLCYHAFPLCDESRGVQQPSKLCKEECEMIENQLCREEYVKARRYPLIMKQFILPNCAELPEPGSVAAQNCIRLGIPGVKVNPGGNSGQISPQYNPGQNTGVKPSKDCYNGTGEQYNGTISKTKSGHTCQFWKINLPEQLKKNPTYKTLLGHNYCRNPGNVETGPWCFTSSKDVQKELCDIPICEEPTPSGSSDMNRLVYILVPGITVPLVYVILIAALCCFCRRKKNKKAQSLAHNPDQQMELSPLTGKAGPRIKEIPLQQIRFLQEMGDGTYGKVYKGEALGLQPGNIPSRVTIKTLKETSSPKVQNDFRREVDTMTELRHPNVICLLGVCMKQQPMCMLFEQAAHGDLHEFLIRFSPHSDVSASDDDGNQRVLEYTEMLHISTNIAAGMEYLASHHYVHKDLAARNIVVGENLSIKISDFGISKDLYSTDYYRAQNKSLLPVRWMSPEAILYAKLSTESDVWSFGVLLWEIFSFGVQPYFGYSNQEVIEMVKNRQILPCPEDCPGRVYALMVDCWHEIPTRRPSFTEAHNKLRSWRSEAMVPNPHWSTCLSQSHSGHSSSTHHSAHSQPSRHSCSGPSTGNNTATTGLTAVSNNSEPMHFQQRPIHAAPVPYMQAIPMQTFGHPMPMAPMPAYSCNYRPAGHFTVNPYLQAKVSPPGSITSKSGSSTSHSSGGNYSRPGPPINQNHVALQPLPPTNNVYNNNVNNLSTPASCAMAVNQADSAGKFSNMLMQNASYIPEPRTSEM